jgi:hypothetical protein
MKKPPTEIERAKALISSVGVNEMARRSGVSRRTLQYMLVGKFSTKYENVQKVLEAGR